MSNINKEKSIRKARYDEQIRVAKENFKQERGLKIARNFKNTDAYKRIERNKNRSYKRLERKIISERVTDDYKGPKIIFKREYREQGQKFYWQVLTDNEGTASNALTEYRRLEQEIGVRPGDKLFGVVVDYDGNRQTYYSDYGFNRALSELAKQGSKLQRYTSKKNPVTGKSSKSTSYYPMVNMQIAEDEKGNFFVIVEGQK